MYPLISQRPMHGSSFSLVGCFLGLQKESCVYVISGSSLHPGAALSFLRSTGLAHLFIRLTLMSPAIFAGRSVVPVLLPCGPSGP